MIGRPLDVIIAPSHRDGFADPAGSAWSPPSPDTRPAEPTETVGCRKDGSCFPMEMDMSQMQIGERTFTIGCIRDISFDEPFRIGGEVFSVRASIGIAFFPQHGRATPDLLRRASRAMRQAKQAGLGLGVFVAEPEDPTARRLTLLSELRAGIPAASSYCTTSPRSLMRGGSLPDTVALLTDTWNIAPAR